MFRFPLFIAMTLIIAFGGGILVSLYALNATAGFGAIKLGHVFIGNFLNAVVSFLFIAGALYLFIIVPVNKLSHKKEEAPPAPSKSETYLKEIRDLLAARKA